MSDYIPKFKPGQAVTFKASEAVKGGNLVEVSGARLVAPSKADSVKVIGVAGFDVPAGEEVTIFIGGPQRLVATDAIASGAPVFAGADGTVSPSGENKIGLAFSQAAKAGDVIDVLL